MERRPSRKSGASRQKRMPTKRRVLLTALILLSVLLAGNYVRLKVVAYQEKKRFDTSEQQIDTLTERIINRFGEPIKQEKSKRCRYASAKYGRGRLSCSISRTFSYPVKDFKEAESLARQIDSYAGEQNDVVARVSDFYTLSGKFRKPGGLVGDTGGATFHTIMGGLESLDVSSRHLIKNSRESLEVSLTAGGAAVAKHYPVLD